jgi:transcriptional regulator with XRE-family HTH domain
VKAVSHDNATIGQRLRTLRLWRGMTLAEVAGLCGVSAAYLSMAERGLRSIDRRSLIADLASALRVSETELTGGPHLTADPVQSTPHSAIPALRAALQTNNMAEAAVERARPLEALVFEVTDRILPLRVKADYAGVGAILPDVIDELHLHIASPKDEAARRLALETLIEACVAATDMSNVLRYTDLAHVAALHARAAAALLDDPVQLGKADVLSLFGFPRERSWERRLATAERAAAALEPHASGPLGIQVLGMLCLHAALAASVMQRPDLANAWLDEATGLARRVTDDMQGNWQYFSSTNVAIWRLVVSVERGETGNTLKLASQVQHDKLTVRARKADFLAETGRGLAREARTSVEAVRWLRRAEETAPQRVRNSSAARETVGYLLTRARAEAGGRELRGMAARMGVAH